MLPSYDVIDFYNPLAPLAIVATVFAFWAIAYLAYQTTIFLYLKNPAEKAYRIWLIPPNEFRTLITLPALSALAAIVAGIGVNYSTSSTKGEMVKLGIQLIAASIAIVVFAGVMLAIGDRSSSAARKLAWRLNDLSARLDDPFVPANHAIMLRAEVKRHARAADRIAKVARNLTFRQWCRDFTEVKELRLLIAVAYSSPLAAVTYQATHIVQSGFEPARDVRFFAVLAIGIFAGIVAPVINYKNEVRRRIMYSEFITQRCKTILFKINRPEKQLRH